MACGESISAAFCGKCWPRCFVSHATSSLALLHAGEESCLAANMVRACPTRGYTNHIITRNQLCWSKWRVSSHKFEVEDLIHDDSMTFARVFPLLTHLVTWWLLLSVGVELDNLEILPNTLLVIKANGWWREGNECSGAGSRGAIGRPWCPQTGEGDTSS